MPIEQFFPIIEKCPICAFIPILEEESITEFSEIEFFSISWTEKSSVNFDKARYESLTKILVILVSEFNLRSWFITIHEALVVYKNFSYFGFDIKLISPLLASSILPILLIIASLFPMTLPPKISAIFFTV